MDPGVATFFGATSIAMMARTSLLEGELEAGALLESAVGEGLSTALLALWVIVVALTLAALWARGWRRGRLDQARSTALHRLTERLLTVQETERRRIATDLHDALGHTLVLAKMRLAMLAASVESGPLRSETLIAELGAAIDQAVAETRDLAHDLRPAALESLGLSAALRLLPEQALARHGARVVAVVEDVDEALPASAHVFIYRILQEALTNALKHAGHAKVSVMVRQRKGRVEAAVEDDGPGFDVSSVRAADACGGWGLATMRERALMLGGELRITSQIGRGTRVHLELPARAGGSSA